MSKRWSIRFISLTTRLNESLELARLSLSDRLRYWREESFAELLDGQRLQYLELSTEQVTAASESLKSTTPACARKWCAL